MTAANSATEPATPDLPRKLMLLIAAVQGIVLLFLYDASVSESWPSKTPVWSFPLWLLAVSIPTLMLLTIETGTERRAAERIGLFAIALLLAGLYVGWQATPYEAFPIDSLTAIFMTTMTLACFKGLMYLQQNVAGKPMSYSVLFTYSWRNFLTLGLATILTFVFWLILWLWANLFEAIGVEFFDNLFREHWFLFPVLSIAHGIGIIIFRSLTGVIDSITRLFEGLIRILLPLAITVAVAFLCTLPFVGLDALWSTGRGTSLMLWLLAIVLFFTNAVYQDGSSERPYPLLVHRMVYVALLTMPIVSVLGFYGLYLRLHEYGWSVARAWGFVVWLVLTLFVAGYTTGILRKRDNWTADLAKVNIGMGLIILVLMLVSNSPLLDFRKLSLDSQVGRVESGLVDIVDFDFSYTWRALARPGYLFMEAKKAEVADSDPDLLAKIANSGWHWQANAGTTGQTRDVFWSNMSYRPEGMTVPGDLRQRIEDENLAHPAFARQVLVEVDLDNDDRTDYLFIASRERYIAQSRLYFLDDNRWQSIAVLVDGAFAGGADAIEEIRNGELRTAEQRFPDLGIGNLLIRPVE